MSQNIISAPVVAELTEKNSRFIAHAFPVCDRASFLRHESELKTRYASANHYTYAYKFVHEDQLFVKTSDDGEPSGTAGKPILAHLEGSNLINVSVFVIRFFGGTKLGTGGLIRAYGGAAKLAIDSAEVTTFVPRTKMSLTVSYQETKQTKYWLKKLEAEIIEESFGENIVFIVSLPTAKVSEAKAKLSGLKLL